MTRVEETIEVAVPVSTAYNQWTQFEEFPEFMENVEEVRQIDDTHLHWVVAIAGQNRDFDAEITEQIPDARIAWRSTDGPGHAGVVDFHRLSETSTEVHVAMETAGDDAAEKVAGATGILGRRVRGDLERFKRLIEERGSESGAWRGEVRPD